MVVVSLGCGTLPPRDGSSMTAAVVASAALLLGWSLLSHVAARQLIIAAKNGQIDPVASANYLDTQLLILRHLGLGVVAMCLAGFGLAGHITSAGIVGDWMSLQSIGLLTPAVAILAMTASAEYSFMTGVDQVDPVGQVGQVGHVGHVDMVHAWRGRMKYIAAHLRGTIAWLAVPVVVLMAISDGISRLPIPASVSALAMPLASLAMVLVGLPMLTRLVFRSTPMDPDRADWYRRLIHAAGGGRIAVSRWDTGRQTANALVAGFVPPWRRLWITDRIEDELPPDQIALIVLHEIGHLRRRHMPLRMLSLIPAWGLGWATTRLMGEAAFAEAAGLGAGLAATLAMLRWVSHATEFDADRWACETAARISAGGGSAEMADAGSIEGLPANRTAAGRSLAAALRRVSFGADPGRSSWLHPSIDARTARLISPAACNGDAVARRAESPWKRFSRRFRNLRSRPNRPQSAHPHPWDCSDQIRC